jgi:hypothetical protein
MLGAESAQRLRRLRRVVGLRRFRGAWPELETLGIVLLALQRLEQPTAIERLTPLRACAHLRWRPAAWRRVAASRAGVLAGVTAGAAVSTYGV